MAIIGERVSRETLIPVTKGAPPFTFTEDGRPLGVMYGTPDGALRQCPYCGRLYKSVMGHVFHSHRMTAREFKQDNGFRLYGGLLSAESTRNKACAYAKTHNLQRQREVIASARRAKSGKQRRSGTTAQFQNERNTCPEQEKFHLLTLAQELGRSPTVEEYNKRWPETSWEICARRMGCARWSEVLQRVGMQPRFQRAPIWDREKVLESIRIYFQNFGKYPTTSAFRQPKENGLPGPSVVNKIFGSVPNARVAAGGPRSMYAWTQSK